jgi:endonuclease/exonuclease/phosphatase family metal-dependent hydrolase
LGSFRGSGVASKSIRLVNCLIILILGASSCRLQSPAEVEFLNKALSDHIRVLSFNVGWDSIFPDDDPQNHQWRQDSKGAEFVRILKAINPDVVCLQEISPDRDPQQVAEILDDALPLSGGKKWQAHNGLDNVIAARFELKKEMDRSIVSGGGTDHGHAMALVDLPDSEYENDIYIICAHFKSAGGHVNIRARQEQADAIINWIGDIKTVGGEIDLPQGTPFVVLGDFNVYDTDPANHLTTLLSGNIDNERKYGNDILPDWDETHLADAIPRHNGAGVETYTWRDDTQEFNPGALDRILFSDSVILIENAFVLNTKTMSEGELSAAELEASDVMLGPMTGRYDHLPLAVDISFK